ncbi:WG repeat-containing protein [Paenibacillus sp. R14(2021)]|uniref:WG repeat-containing protein n=1 Tax=Paenibacillus sp. R14(2021) TaxID=2859228 RepID=UPI001C613E72|nr:WG repeat-containing protein [Paenibacillus sp. R14(2021)]
MKRRYQVTRVKFLVVCTMVLAAITPNVVAHSASVYKISPKYTFAEKFSEGLAAVRLNDDYRWGYIDTSGQMVISPKFEEVGQFHDGLAEVRWNGLVGFINAKGKTMIPFKYRDAQDFQNGVAWVNDGLGWNLIDKKGNTIANKHYQVAFPFIEGLARVAENREYGWGYIDKKGKVVIPLQYKFAPFDFTEGFATVKDMQEQYYLIDAKGKTTAFGSHTVTNFDNGFAVVGTPGTKQWAIYNKSGQLNTLSEKYDLMVEFHEGMAPIRVNHKWGFIDQSGKKVIPPQYEEFNYDMGTTNGNPIFQEGLAAAVQKNGKMGFIDKTGKIVVPFIYDHVHDFSGGIASVYKNGLAGFIDKTGRVVIPLQFAGFKVDPMGATFNSGLEPARDKSTLLWGYITKPPLKKTTQGYELLSGDKNIISLKAAKNATFCIYGIKFLSKPNDKNLIPLPKLTRT